MTVEEIVLLDEAGHAVGTAPKFSSHHADTPYHLAFSCYLIDERGRVLITQRANSKRVFPSVLTNSACGHPAPGESLRSAVRRRLHTELGLDATDFTLVLPEFSYRATAPDGTVEWERCPVVRAVATGDPVPNPDEVEAAGWRTWTECLELAGSSESSPWYRMQMAELTPLGTPADWPEAAPDRLPPALSW